MDSYVCDRCGYSTKYRQRLKTHLNRKNICPPKLSTITVNELCDNYGIKRICSEMTPNDSEIAPKSSEISENCSEMTPIDSGIFTPKSVNKTIIIHNNSFD